MSNQISDPQSTESLCCIFFSRFSPVAIRCHFSPIWSRREAKSVIAELKYISSWAIVCYLCLHQVLLMPYLDALSIVPLPTCFLWLLEWLWPLRLVSLCVQKCADLWFFQRGITRQEAYWHLTGFLVTLSGLHWSRGREFCRFFFIYLLFHFFYYYLFFIFLLTFYQTFDLLHSSSYCFQFSSHQKMASEL